MVRVLLPLLFVAASLLSLRVKEELRAERATQNSAIELPPLYLPQAQSIKAVTLGFDNFVSDVLWFNTLNYFGAQREQKKGLDWLGHMCDLVTSLDQHALPVYEFCGALLAWVANEPDKSNEILLRGAQALPTAWRLRYLRGFNYWYFIQNYDQASNELKLAAEVPGAPPFLASLASRLLSSHEDPATAVAFLKDLLKNTTNSDARTALLEQLRRGQLSLDLHKLRKAVDYYRTQNGSNPTSAQDLVTKGIIRDLPRDPFGGEYIIDPTTGEVSTTSNEKGLEFSGNTAESKRKKHQRAASDQTKN